MEENNNDKIEGPKKHNAVGATIFRIYDIRS
jgi:hypothetical protein